MPLPPAVIVAGEAMKQAQAALHAYVDGGQHDRDRHRTLVENLQRAINTYLDQITVLARDNGMQH